MAPDRRPGWRIEIKKYPKLTEIGSKRIDGEGTEYGGFYTQEEVKDIVKYAADRFITIVPEIELPGHEMAAIAAYPELSCEGKQGTPRIIWGVEDIVLCAGKEEPFQFFEDVIAEVAPYSRASISISEAMSARRRAGRNARFVRPVSGRKA